MYLKKFDCSTKDVKKAEKFNKFFSLMFDWSLINIELIDSSEKNNDNELNTEDDNFKNNDMKKKIDEEDVETAIMNNEWLIVDHSYINHRLINQWRLANELSERYLSISSIAHRLNLFLWELNNTLLIWDW